MKISKIILLPLFILSCVNSNIPEPNISNTPSPSISSTPSILPSPSISSTPSPSVNPEENINLNRSFKLGISRAFSRITDDITPDKLSDRKNFTNIINELSTDNIIIDFNQFIIDRNLDGSIEDDNGEFPFYKEIIEEFGNKNIFLRIDFKDLPSSSTKPKLFEFLLFFDSVNKELKDYKNISWIIEDKINSKNFNPEPEKELVSFVKDTSSIIKKYNKNSKVYLGSLLQSELFSQRISYTPDNLLNYINLGISDYCDGFILEFYDILSSNSYLPYSYKTIYSYYNILNNTLKIKNISNKNIMLITSTFSGSISAGQVEDEDDEDILYNLGDFQNEQQQAGLIIRNIIYGLYSGFDNIFLPKVFDEEHSSLVEVMKKSGIINEIYQNEGDLNKPIKKLSYWSVRLLNKVFNGSKLIKKIDTPYSGIEAFLFENTNKFIYIIWNDMGERFDTINIPLENTKGNIYNLPYDFSTRDGILLPFSLDKKEIGLSFSRNPYIPIIVEVEK